MNHFSYVPLGPGDRCRHLPEPVRAESGRWPKLEAALAVVNRDVLATLPGQEPLILMCLPSCAPPCRGATNGDQIYVAMADGRWQGNQVNACDPEEGEPPEPDDAETALGVVAEAAQDTVMELLWQAWPLCPAHGTGMHLLPPDTGRGWYPSEAELAGPPAWWCGGGQEDARHRVSPVGELAAARAR
ncbi:hypothetical protein OG233_13245 [Streptomyces sp. NBC_01218]|uniref:hypothetical protein n=1 Tax=unclassified Streptomyces TaxID=2593676 RepID=UPI0023B9491F|nr:MULTISPECIES: hypothetical protein [unclassified Streptomyces]WEH40373.1 hypothetical protein PZB77_13100 [Streptomyces sp. AM 2-1-1]WSQ52065.1 hypothetical protein OG233_13245 [Streptomyces sp. NBC_01218]